MTHTPGPWIAGINGDNEPEGKFFLIGGDGVFFARVARDVPGHEREYESNARLIAAAPQLLAALRKAEELVWRRLSDHAPEVDDFHVQAAHAIAKATGGAE